MNKINFRDLLINSVGCIALSAIITVASIFMGSFGLFILVICAFFIASTKLDASATSVSVPLLYTSMFGLITFGSDVWYLEICTAILAYFVLTSSKVKNKLLLGSWLLGAEATLFAVDTTYNGLIIEGIGYELITVIFFLASLFIYLKDSAK